MNRSTSQDKMFKQRVSEEFIRARDRAVREGMSVEAFVQTLGITRAAFHKHITGKAIPSLRVLQRARSHWGVKLSYGELGDRYVTGNKSDPKQMEFQFSVGDISKEQIQVTRFGPKGENSAELVIRIDFSKSA